MRRAVHKQFSATTPPRAHGAGRNSHLFEDCRTSRQRRNDCCDASSSSTCARPRAVSCLGRTCAKHLLQADPTAAAAETGLTDQALARIARAQHN